MKNILKKLYVANLMLLLGSGALGCRTLPGSDLDSFGLPLVKIEVESEDEAVLNSTIWEKSPVAADLTIEGKTWRVDLKYSGKSSLDDFKKSYEIHFRGQDGYQGRSELKLSAQAVDLSALRSALGLWAYKQGGVLSSDIEPISLYLNGKYKGLYFQIENIDEDFFRSHYIDRGIVYKAIFGNADFSASTLNDPASAFSLPLDKKEYTVIRRISELVMSSAPVVSRVTDIEAIVDVRAILDYVAVSVAINHFDGFANNYYFYLDRSVGKFRVLPWDLDRIFESDTVNYTPSVSLWGGNKLSLLLLEIPEYKTYYLEKLQSLLAGPLSLAGMQAQLDLQKNAVAKAWVNDRVLSAKDRTLDSEASQLFGNITSWHQKLSDDLAKEIAKQKQ